ncbi:GNAT family N-acetyltransferase [Rhodococcus rhodnii]|uniref:Hemolysin n=2 Tax=Rhodococcus rhodnii TaxID=38312 RepID=R7WM10_9NOCA|nr:GNAT family N-acyltransferase [Rhodococcus rhodnii]EOM76300.1 hypothetical protein Rrhod_2400 [Rhodococcus rhodnii LMG 5362]TXG92627.1 GNAT family N-acetyltransferase [Rhodococcus rhodnii]
MATALARAATSARPALYSLTISTDRRDRVAVQRLRHRVFSAEPGFRLPDDAASRDGRDADRFDDHCDHLLVRYEPTGEVVGCYRMLPPDAAERAGGYYSANEFDLTGLAPHRNRIVEMGRACVAAEHRTGSVVALMWSGILGYLELTRHDVVMGCVSVPMERPGTDRGGDVRGVRDLVRSRHAYEPGVVTPRRRVVVGGRTLDEIAPPPRTAVPPLMRGYLRIGARVCGEPSFDPEFDVADFVTVLALADADRRYLERLRGAADAVRS